MCSLQTTIEHLGRYITSPTTASEGHYSTSPTAGRLHIFTPGTSTRVMLDLFLHNLEYFILLNTLNYTQAVVMEFRVHVRRGIPFQLKESEKRRLGSMTFVEPLKVEWKPMVDNLECHDTKGQLICTTSSLLQMGWC